jgi:hypothetical protein
MSDIGCQCAGGATISLKETESLPGSLVLCSIKTIEMTKEEKQERLFEMRASVAKAAEEIQRNADPYASVIRLAEALEMVLGYLERQEE